MTKEAKNNRTVETVRERERERVKFSKIGFIKCVQECDGKLDVKIIKNRIKENTKRIGNGKDRGKYLFHDCLSFLCEKNRLNLGGGKKMEKMREKSIDTRKVKAMQEEGITLMVLAVTIIIIIILATITINIAFGDNGLINLARQTKKDAEDTVEGTEGEMSEIMDEYTNIMSTDGGFGEVIVGNITFGDTIWRSNNTASVTVSTDSEYSIEYQVGGTEEGNWIEIENGGSIENLTYPSTVYARLYKGEKHGNYVSASIIDLIKPQKATIALSSSNVTTGTAVRATVTHKDNESGINIGQSRYVWTKSNEELGTNASVYTGGNFTSNSQEISSTMSSTGTYYLHVLSMDKAGNAVETVSEGVTVRQLATGISVSPTTVTLMEGQTRQLSATVTPTSTSNKGVTWSSSNSGVASVSSSGLVTAVKKGSAVITVKTNDGSNKTASCTVTVNYPTIESKLKQGNYVNYVDSKGVTRKCMVLYGPENANYSSYGIQIITMDIVEKLTFGHDDPTTTGSDNFTKAMNSYNKAISRLNTSASVYNNSTYSTLTRCVGSVPNNINYDAAGMFTSSYSYFKYNGKFKDSDTNYSADVTQMRALGIQCIKDNYWLASRVIYSDAKLTQINVRYVVTDTLSLYGGGVCHANSEGFINSFSFSYGLRPVFRLKTGIKVVGGSGTSGDPYKLGV